ncbi:MAG: RidA family protein [Rhodospirillaceae bacterium]|jgi:2-iminobutanoate/2-iminopropanoate deaminase|nr:RidA family protein [Rhodospirillaceae bacterium]MBT5456050.1 RidA family protein [Rhodospirillaceae bacterium]
MAHKRVNPDTIRPPGGNYTHSIEVDPGARFLYVAGQTGVAQDGTIPDGIEAQAELVFDNINKVLAASGYGLEDVVFLKTFMTSRDDREGYQAIRSKFWGDVKPASTFLLVSGLANPKFLLEVEVVAAKPA